jgi:hypothetical protein
MADLRLTASAPVKGRGPLVKNSCFSGIRKETETGKYQIFCDFFTKDPVKSNTCYGRRGSSENIRR